MALGTFAKDFGWRKFSSHQKHMILMYLYRVETDLEHIEEYLETYRFREYKINVSDLPDRILKLSPEKIRAMAYAEIGAKLP